MLLLILFSRGAWLQALKMGDRNAFTQLYDFYWQRLFSVAYNYTRSRETAQELVQDVFMSIWVKREELVVRTNLESYLYGAIRFRLYDLLDKQKSAVSTPTMRPTPRLLPKKPPNSNWPLRK